MAHDRCVGRLHRPRGPDAIANRPAHRSHSVGRRTKAETEITPNVRSKPFTEEPALFDRGLLIAAVAARAHHKVS